MKVGAQLKTYDETGSRADVKESYDQSSNELQS